MLYKGAYKLKYATTTTPVFNHGCCFDVTTLEYTIDALWLVFVKKNKNSSHFYIFFLLF